MKGYVKGGLNDGSDLSVVTATAQDIRSGKNILGESGLINGALDLSALIPENLKKDIVIDGKTGTLIEKGTAKMFATGTTSTFNIVVTGLTFSPSKVFISGAEIQSSIAYFKSLALLSKDLDIISCNSTAPTNYRKVFLSINGYNVSSYPLQDTSTINCITADGFSCNMLNISGLTRSFIWWAYE